MRVAHIANMTPGQCGLYETTRDLVIHERRLGVDARIVDIRNAVPTSPSTVKPAGSCPQCGFTQLQTITPERTMPDWAEDRGVVKAPLTWLESVDVICSHSGIPDHLPHGAKAPRIHVAHGRPHSSFLLGQQQNNHVWKAYENYAKDDRWKAIVTLWPGFGKYWQLVFPRPVHEFSPFVDLERWKPCKSDYNFGGKSGEPNIVISDVWRQDKDPFQCLFAFAEFAKAYPDAKLHLYGLNPNDSSALSPILTALQNRGVLGEVKGHVDNLVEIYNAADLLLTPHIIATRTIREAMACGLSVVAGGDQPYTPYGCEPERTNQYADVMTRAWGDVSKHREARRSDTRTAAECLFDPMKTAMQFVKLFEELAK